MADIYRYRDDTTLKKKTLQTIFGRRQVSRGELTGILGLSLTSITKFVGALISEGIVAECGTLDSTGGRKTNLLGINPDYAWILGIDIGGYATKLGVVRFDGSVVEDWFYQSMNEEAPVNHVSPRDLIKLIRQVFEKYDQSRFLAVCVGISGMVNHESGSVIFCPNLVDWNDVPLGVMLLEAFHLPVFIDTSARCMALAEQRYGAGIGISDQILLSLGNYDIAAGLILNSEIYRGNSGFAGEIGHVMSSDKGERCTCGNFDCLELSATLMMIMDNIMSQTQNIQSFSPLLQLLPTGWERKDLTPSVVSQAIQAGDKLCYEIVMTAGKHAGIALSNLLNVLNPGLVILGGSVIEFFPIILDTIQNTIRERVLIPIGQKLDVRKAKMDWRSAVVGSAIMALTEFFR